MRLVSLDKINDLIISGLDTVNPKHARFFADFSYPEIWFRCWLIGLQRYLQQRQQREKK